MEKDCIKYKGNKYTTVSYIVESLIGNDKYMYKHVRNMVDGVIKSSKEVQEAKEKVEKKDLDEENTKFFKGNRKDVVLIRLDVVEIIKNKVAFKVKRLKEGKYKKDRYYAKRDIYQELTYVLKENNIKIDRNLFIAILNCAKRIEDYRVAKADAIKRASKKYGETQKDIKNVIDKMQIKYSAQEHSRKMYASERSY